ncbi:paraquat-inducible protein A [Dyella acidisoli]|uniref:Paraquat-inducible protein A n=1 Tax=Dyella acidisoli TaxID=1867834 RepID=A0ABQ5XIT0_9GAMM|nr:paraquat-inducible protein A [Dyella acidisoli]GLQ91589.1 paraquat-inducible protein A [Dyella acidisoli]
MKAFPTLIVCEHCDAVYRRPTLAPGEGVRCEICAAPFLRLSRLDVDHWLALTMTSAVIYVIANVCPIIRVSFNGLHNETTLWRSVAALAHGPVTLMAVPATLTVIVVPLLHMLLLGWVLLYARRGRRAPGFRIVMKLLVTLRPWSMIEVALIGILVSIIKLAGFLHVVPGVGLWAMGVLTVLFTLIASPDTRHLWSLTESDVAV